MIWGKNGFGRTFELDLEDNGGITDNHSEMGMDQIHFEAIFEAFSENYLEQIVVGLTNVMNTGSNEFIYSILEKYHIKLL